MLDVWFEGVRVVLSKAAERELFDLCLRVTQAVDVLEHGFDCSRSKRKREVIEKCLRKGDKILRVVGVYDYNRMMGCEVLVIIHVSIEGIKWSSKLK